MNISCNSFDNYDMLFNNKVFNYVVKNFGSIEDWNEFLNPFCQHFKTFFNGLILLTIYFLFEKNLRT